MLPLLRILGCALAALLLASEASATSFGVSDSHPVGMKDGGARFYALMRKAGLTENRLTVLWNPDRPTTIERQAELELAVEQARLRGIETIFAVQPAKATALSSSPSAPEQFVTFLQLLAKAFPGVTSFVVGNEFNQPRFYQPQFGAGCRRVSGRGYVQILARAYDALHAVNPNMTVISSVSPRGNDNCKAKSNRSTSPVRFIHDMGAGYRALHRDRPAFDEFGIHLYPNQPTDTIARGYRWPKIGASNLGRLKQALWDAFAGTAQPVPDWQPSVLRYGQGAAALRPAKIWEGEVGWQVAIKKKHRAAYHGRENVKVTTEARQAKIYAKLVRSMSCDRLVDAMLFFGFVDEPNLARFQSGLLRADWSKRPSYSAVRRAVAKARNGCRGTKVRWHHKKSVVGARVRFGNHRRWKVAHTQWRFSVRARENAHYTAGIYRTPSRGLSQEGRRSILGSLLGKRKPRPALRSRNAIKAYWSQLVHFPARRLGRGTYVYAIRMAAEMNPSRAKMFVSRPFRVR